MHRRVSLWTLAGVMVACCWVAIAFFAAPSYNPGRSTLAAITAPASLLGRTEPLGILGFVLINGVLYGVAGFATESLRWAYHYALSRRAA